MGMGISGAMVHYDRHCDRYVDFFSAEKMAVKNVGRGAIRMKKTIFICYAKCSTCQKAQEWLDGHKIAYTKRAIKEQNPSAEELRDWWQKSGLPLKKFFNTSGLIYRAMGLKEKLPAMSEEEQLDLLATDGMLVKRPLLITDDLILVGFKEAEWSVLE